MRRRWPSSSCRCPPGSCRSIRNEERIFMTMPPQTVLAERGDQDDLLALKQLRTAYDTMRAEIGRVVIGQNEVIEELLIAVFARGHCVLVGVPGLAKTLLVSTLSRTLSLSFKRIQFTPDLMPADITG